MRCFCERGLNRVIKQMSVSHDCVSNWQRLRGRVSSDHPRATQHRLHVNTKESNARQGKPLLRLHQHVKLASIKRYRMEISKQNQLLKKPVQ